MTARSLLNSALDWWESRNPGTPPGRNATSDAYQTVARRVKENPLPSLFIGFGLVWLIIDATTNDDEDAPALGKWRASQYKGERPDESGTSSSYPVEYFEEQDETGDAGGLAESAKNKLGEAKEAVLGSCWGR